VFMGGPNKSGHDGLNCCGAAPEPSLHGLTFS
jgi:hypothetical protein